MNKKEKKCFKEHLMKLLRDMTAMDCVFLLKVQDS